MMEERDRLRFARLCEKEAAQAEVGTSADGIGTYGEKRLHRILKRWICENDECYEVKVGRYIADVLDGEELTEIQTGSLRPLAPKLRYYLEHTDYRITVVYPLIAEKTLFCMNRESGEVLSKKRSPKHGRAEDAPAELFWISDWLPSPRLTVQLLLITVDEYRFSERIRYRKAGAYDAERYPRTLSECICLREREDYRQLLPDGLNGFTAEEYAKQVHLKGRKLYSALNFLCALSLLRREKENNRYRYWIV